MNDIIFIANTFLPFVIMAAIFYFMLWRPQKQDQKKRKEFLDSLKSGDKISAGIKEGKVTFSVKK